MAMFDEAGFDIQTIDLNTEEIPEDVRILVISNPQNDFQGFDGENPNVRTEMVKINEYMQSYRSLIVLVNKDTPALPEPAGISLGILGPGLQAAAPDQR